jgi:AP-4 complex subunit beta-1
VSNVIVALSEIQRATGGIVLTRGLCVRLLKKMKTFNDWSQCIVLDFLFHYKPDSNKECFAIMNALDSCLQVSHSGVVLGATKIFLKCVCRACCVRACVRVCARACAWVRCARVCLCTC